METLLATQKSLLEELTKLQSNTKKDGPSRMNENYLRQRLKKLNELWTNFCANNTELSPFRDGNPTQPYFSQNVYHQTKNIYDEFSAYLGKKLCEISGGGGQR